MQVRQAAQVNNALSKKIVRFFECDFVAFCKEIIEFVAYATANPCGKNHLLIILEGEQYFKIEPLK